MKVGVLIKSREREEALSMNNKDKEIRLNIHRL